jgi:Flp pilus assembly protein TadG
MFREIQSSDKTMKPFRSSKTTTGTEGGCRRSRTLAAARLEHGVAAVEFAVVLPLLLMIVFGVFDFGRAMNYKNQLTQLANQAARYASVNRDPADPTSPFPDNPCALKSYLSANADTTEIAGMIDNGTVSVTPGSTVGDPVTVRVTTTFSFLPFISSTIGAASTSLSGEATMRLEQVPTYGGGSCSS